MSARCQWQWASLTRGGGAKLMIVALSCGFALASSPQLHERVHHNSARPAHPCAIILRNADKCVKTVKKQPAGAAVASSPVAPLSEHPVTTSGWVPNPFLEARRCEHGPPRLDPGASVQISGLLA